MQKTGRFKMLDGMNGFSLHLSPEFLSVALTDGTDPAAWLRALPTEITGNPAILSMSVLPSAQCEE